MTIQSFFRFAKFIILALFLSACHPSSDVTADTGNMLGQWAGSIEIQGQQLPLVIHLSVEENSQIGIMDSPSQGGYGVPMTKVKFDDENLLFEIKNLGIHYEGTYNAVTQNIEGDFIQGSPYKLDFSRAKEDVIEKSTSSDFKDVIDTWNGEIEIPNSPLAFVLHIEEDDDGANLQAKADSPNQNAYGIDVTTVTFKEGVLEFTIENIGAEFKGELLKDASEIKGKFKQNGATFILNFKRGQYEKK